LAAVSTSAALPSTLTLGQDAGDPAVSADQECRPGDPHEGLAVHRLFAPYPISLEHLVGLVGAERDGQIVLGLEFVLGCDRVGRHPQNVGASLLEFAVES